MNTKTSKYISNKIFFAGFLFHCIITLNIYGQDSAKIDFQMWTDYNLSIVVSERFSYGGDAGLRGIISSEDWNQIYIRPSASYHFNKIFKVKGGLGSFKSFYKESSNTFELRLFQDLNIKWPDFNRVALFYRIRIEERYFIYQNLPDDFEVRCRLLIGLKSSNFKLFSQKKTFYYNIEWETLFPLSKQSSYDKFINKARITALLGHHISDNFWYELNYTWQRSRQYTDEGLKTDEHVFRIRIFHKIKQNKSK